MLPALARTYDELKTQKMKLLAKLHSMTPEQLSYKPTPETWSILQVIDHLVKTERGIIQQLPSRLEKAAPVSFTDRLRGNLVIFLFRTPARVKVPPAAANAILPDEQLDVPSLTEGWNASRETMRSTLEQVSQPAMKLAAFRHPRTGSMNLTQTLSFLSVHITHHNFQIARIERDWKISANPTPA